MQLVKITDLTGQLGVSSRSLRYYEQVGLIESQRPEFQKYRYYDAESVERLKQILVLRKMQIPIKDIIRIYESRDMGAVVEAFVARIQSIDRQIGALSELKRIVNEFLQTMMKNGITRISALPLLYEEAARQMETCEASDAPAYERLSAAAEALTNAPDIRLVELPAMRMLSSVREDSGFSDTEGLWAWLEQGGIPLGLPGRHEQFEYQNADGQTVLLQKIGADFTNDGPFTEIRFPGGLFAAGGVYADEDMAAIHGAIIRSFDDNPYYQIDYTHAGRLRHETLAQAVLSPDCRREKIELLVPVKKRLPDASLYEPFERVEGLSVREIEEANPVLWQKSVPMDGFEPILSPYYRVNDAGEAEYIAYIDKRVLSTGVAVKLPFRVDIEFKVESKSYAFSSDSNEGSIRFYHGSDMFGVNMDNNSESGLSKEAVCFNQPVFGDYFRYPRLGRFELDAYNRLTWIVGEKHFAVIINGEVRYCGVNFPYMTLETRMLPAHPIIIGSNGSRKKIFRSVAVSQLRYTPKILIQGGVLRMNTRQSNNIIPGIHRLITHHYGENYWFNGCALYVMECLGEKDYDYWFFSGLTGDNLAQVFSYDRFRGDGATDYQVGAEKGRFIERVFARCGYASTFVPQASVKANTEMYLMAYIDKGVPVIRSFYGWGVFVGYESFGKTLLYLTSDKPEPQRVPCDELFISQHPAFPDQPGEQADELSDFMGDGWCFVGEKKKQVALDRLYRDVILDMPRLLTVKNASYCFGAEAFRAWADEVESGRFDGMKPEAFCDWAMYKIYVCNVATNGSCRAFLERALAHNPDMAFLEEIIGIYKKLGILWAGGREKIECLESLGGGFNITLEALQNHEKRGRIAAKIREFAACMDRVLEILNENLPSGEASR